MPRLIDDIRTAGRCAKPWFVSRLQLQWLKHSLQLTEFLADPMPIIVADKLAASYFASEQERWALDRDFGDLTPAHDLFWIEYKLPRVIHSRECGDTNVARYVKNGRVGILFLAPPVANVKGEGIPAEAAWILTAEIFVDYGEGRPIQGPHGTWFLTIDAEGKVLDRPLMQGYHDPSQNEILKSFVSWLHPALLAIPFLRARADEMEVNL